MATDAQKAANSRNAQKSTGPKTDRGKMRSRGNALKHGMAALTIMPVLPQEDRRLSEERFREWENHLQPQNAAERRLVLQAAWLSLAVERGERMEIAHMAGRVGKAGRMRVLKLNPRRRKQVRELGRRLLYIAGPEELKIDYQPLWADDPGMLVSQLEESAEGCRWLIERWEEYRNLLDHRVNWEEGVLIRFIRLQGKELREAVFDPAVNSILLAWDVLVPNYAKVEWESYRKEKPKSDPAYNHRLHWQEIGRRPSDQAEAWASLYAIVDDQRQPAQGAADPEPSPRSGRGRGPQLGRPGGDGSQPWVRAAPALPVGQVARAGADARYALQAAQGGNRDRG